MHIGGGAVCRVNHGLTDGDHAAQLVFGVDLMCELDRLGRSHQLIVGGGQHDRRVTGGHARAEPAGHVHAVDFIEGDPVFDLAPIAAEQRFGIAQIAVDGAAVAPCAPLIDKTQRHFIVADGHDGFNSVLMALIENSIVKGKALFVGGLLIAIGENAAPRNGHTVGGKAHLGKEGDVLFVVVVEVDALMVRVPDIGQHGEGCALWQIVQIDHGNFAGGTVLIAIGQVARLGGRAAGQHVIGGGAAAVCIPRTLQLVKQR